MTYFLYSFQKYLDTFVALRMRITKALVSWHFLFATIMTAPRRSLLMIEYNSALCLRLQAFDIHFINDTTDKLWWNPRHLVYLGPTSLSALLSASPGRRGQLRCIKTERSHTVQTGTQKHTSSSSLPSPYSSKMPGATRARELIVKIEVV
jgi:hypothetical protein